MNAGVAGGPSEKTDSHEAAAYPSYRMDSCGLRCQLRYRQPGWGLLPNGWVMQRAWEQVLPNFTFGT